MSWQCRAQLAARLAKQLEVGSRKLLIVGIVNNSTALAKTPNLFVTTEGVQQLEFGGQPLISSIGIRGTLSQVPAGYRVVNRNVAVDDLMRPTKIAVQAIRIVAILLWIVAGLIVGGVVYLSALERMRDFAVFKAIGVSTRSILAGLVLQAIVVAILAAGFGAGLARLLAPLFPMNVIEPASAYPLLGGDSRRGRAVGQRYGSPAGCHRRSRTRIWRSLIMSDLRIHDLVVEYPSGGNAIRPIDGLDLELEAGSLNILLGPSGCGKTTLLSCLGGLLTPTSGQITVGDVDVTALQRPRDVAIPAPQGRHRVPGVQPSAKPDGTRERPRAATRGRSLAQRRA